MVIGLLWLRGAEIAIMKQRRRRRVGAMAFYLCRCLGSGALDAANGDASVTGDDSGAWTDVGGFCISSSPLRKRIRIILPFTRFLVSSVRLGFILSLLHRVQVSGTLSLIRSGPSSIFTLEMLNMRTLLKE